MHRNIRTGAARHLVVTVVLSLSVVTVAIACGSNPRQDLTAESLGSSTGSIGSTSAGPDARNFSPGDRSTADGSTAVSTEASTGESSGAAPAAPPRATASTVPTPRTNATSPIGSQSPTPTNPAEPLPPATKAPSGAHAQPWDGYTVGAGGRTLDFTYYAGVEPCSIFHSIVAEEVGITVRVTIYEASGPEDTVCIMLAQAKRASVTLANPLGGRTVIDGA